MNVEDIATVDELTEFMNAQAVAWGRTDSEQPYVNGNGIQKQWHERMNFPFAVFYLVGKEADENENDITSDPFPRADGVPKVIFEMKAMWFDIDGNVTERPKRNTGTLYRNE